MADTKSQNNKSSNRIILIALSTIIIIAAGIFLYAGWVGYQEAPKIIEVRDAEDPSNAPYIVSSEQSTALDAYGYPEAFTILFYEEETFDQGIQTVRLETWEYYTLGIGLSYINGELVSEDAIEIADLGQLSPLPYHPDQFSAFMSLNEVIGTTDIVTYIEIPLVKEIMDRGNLYYAESLSFGLQENQLVYVEALALTDN